MEYHFENLVFEGGGVKGIAYVGALEELEERGILSQVRRVGGTSAGAIVATLVGLGYTVEEVREVLWGMDFEKFLDSSWGVVRDIKRLTEEFGWYKGDYFRAWIGDLIEKKTGNANITFEQAEKLVGEKGVSSIYFMVTNLSTGFSEVMSAEKHPGMCVADGVRFSMSLPIFFTAKRGMRGDMYVDGGVLDNYPIKLFDRAKYLSDSATGVKTKYYAKRNRTFLKKHPSSSPYIFNKHTLGFKLDSSEEISRFGDQAEPVVREITDLFDFAAAVITTYYHSQSNIHLHSDDWQRTIYIDTLGVGMVDFNISKKTKEALVESGRKGTRDYFAWYDAAADAVNK